MLFLGEILILCYITVVVYAQNEWCDPKLCAPGKKHIGCFDGGYPRWESICERPEEIKITPELQNIILHEHNKLRNQQALGLTPYFSPATRMATMTWDNDLAATAHYNTLQCEMKHDECRGTYDFYYAGQNLAKNADLNATEIAKWAPGYWFEEWMYADMSDIFEHTRSQLSNGEWIGHFTQIVKDDCVKVGCAISKFSERGSRRSLITCNYSMTNIKNSPIYEVGPTASHCKTGTNYYYPGLCSVYEKYE
ncbi:antigen 5 like allergen Cul n 1-like [Contarinia nasturtii]|uniref:antigen 5 like allergen Cul n 1-like n=1 Tax=Contarinia nasturtii TaxID=265458 RepID=UPI0012D43C2E|nr:antigen 5 like allergen Cul n 1-like [Contarinia nasturtii]